jgi:pyrroline-5-carboxylate reductase
MDPKFVWILDPKPSEWVLSVGVRVNEMLPDDPAVVLVAVKPQMMGEALPRLQRFSSTTTLFISVAAGTSISAFEDVLGRSTPVVRAMPNTPAAIGQGITALIGNDRATDKDLAEAQSLMAAVGQTILLHNEGQLDAVTGVSGSGPAYVFHMIETLAEAGIKQGLPAVMAMRLAQATVAGAGALAGGLPGNAMPWSSSTVHLERTGLEKRERRTQAREEQTKRQRRTQLIMEL